MKGIAMSAIQQRARDIVWGIGITTRKRLSQSTMLETQASAAPLRLSRATHIILCRTTRSSDYGEQVDAFHRITHLG